MVARMLESAAYYVALFTVVGVPPGIFLWFLIHPFADRWRRVGPAITYLVVTPILIAIGAGIYHVREPLLRTHFGVKAPLMVISTLLLMVGVYIGMLRMRHLTPSLLLGIPELSHEGKAGKLLTEGIYGLVRHPRYLEIGFVLAAIALFVNYLAVYLLLLAYVPVIYLVVLLEERELKARFGDAYETYCRRVPRFVPRLRRRKKT